MFYLLYYTNILYTKKDKPIVSQMRSTIHEDQTLYTTPQKTDMVYNYFIFLKELLLKPPFN